MTPLKDIVFEYLAEEERDTPHKFKFYLNLAFGGYRDLYVDAVGKIEYIAMPLDADSYSVSLPPNCINLISAGYIRNSEYIAFTRSEKVMGGAVQLPTDVTLATVNGEQTYSGSPRYIVNGQLTGSRYGLGGGTIMSYRESKSDGKVYFNTLQKLDYVVLECLVDIEQLNGEYLVHDFLIEPIKNWIDWKSKARKTTVSGSEKERLKAQYYNSKDAAKIKLAALSSDKFKNAMRKNFKLTPRI